ncbi:hypothetical protein INT48_006552 [Thamnidium elegans]|uniref:Wax synthase domain-containing protein n=1 Tax=Thamnidium elegans TaxID=101142 RepID=A0A8H7SK71_9FUNG|nr:hypothetical protein INT48_006552 [Thamnidium elegans]
MDYTISPFIDIDLPPPLYVLPVVTLTLINVVVLMLDYVLYSSQKHFFPFISPTLLRLIMCSFHMLLPMFVISDHPPSNGLFTVAPWLLAVYSATFPMTDTTKFMDWFNALLNTAYEPRLTLEQKNQSITDIRYAGLAKALLGVFKFVFLFVIVNRLLPPVARNTIEFPWFSLKSISFILLFGTKHYCLLGILDIAFGVMQIVLGKHTIESMHEPFFSTSPRDFWGRRWNLFVSHFLHSQVFSIRISTTVDKKKKGMIKKKQIWTQTKEFRGFMSFFASGVFHEMMIMSINRKITLENFVFFLIHGLAAYLEIKFRKAYNLKQDPTGITRILCNVCTVVFFGVTGRLFVSPYLRDSFFDFNHSSIWKNLK